MDITLYSAEYGGGFPLLLLHGNGEDGDYFKGQIASFAAHFRVITVDTRGHGRSPRGEAPFTLEQFAEDLSAFMALRHIDRAHLLGFSDGANIALLFALRHPEMVGKLILNGGNLSPSGVKPLAQLPVVLGWGLTCVLAPFEPRAAAKRELLGLMAVQPHIAPEALHGLTMPVLVMAGSRDMIRDAHTRRIAAAIPGARLSILDGTHFVAAENPEPFNRQVLQFLLQEE